MPIHLGSLVSANLEFEFDLMYYVVSRFYLMDNYRRCGDRCAWSLLSFGGRVSPLDVLNWGKVEQDIVLVFKTSTKILEMAANCFTLLLQQLLAF